MSPEYLNLRDTRTSKTYDLAISDGAIKATDLRQIKKDQQNYGLLSYDPALRNTAICRSSITEVDGNEGTMTYRGYPVAQLARSAPFLEVAYLLIYGELPTSSELQQWRQAIMAESLVHESVQRFLRGFRYDAQPMGVLAATIAAMSTAYEDARDIDEEAVDRHTKRLIAKVPTLAAFAFRRSSGLPYVYPDTELSYTGNFLNMLFKMTELKYTPDPLIERVLNALFILHADHAQNCSTTTMRVVGSSLTDPYTAVSAAATALYGQRHGGAGETVLQMLQEIGSPDRIPDLIAAVKRGERRLIGFGHRAYKKYDPRALLIKDLAMDIIAKNGGDPLLDVALALEEQALADSYFIERSLYPNVDFYSGLVYQALGLPPSMFTVMFAIPRTVGWLAHWREKLQDPDQRIARPRQIYVGPGQRDYVPLAQREAASAPTPPPPSVPEGALIASLPSRNQTYELTISEGAVRAPEWSQIKLEDKEEGLVVYDSSLLNTATCRSSITYIDGEKGILRYRGYPIEQLIEQSTFLETAYLLIYGELPDQAQYERWTNEVLGQSLVHDKIRYFLDGFQYDAHPMGILIGAVSGAFHLFP